MTTEIVEKPEGSIADFSAYERQFKMAKFLSQSNLLPQHFKGKEADCFIALEMSNRTGASFLEVVQNLFVVNGQPAWKATFVIAQINRSKKFDDPLAFDVEGEGIHMNVTATASRKGKVYSAMVSMKMAAEEKWTSNPKYKSMPEQMLTYRAACFFGRKYCPEVMFGMYTKDELEDVDYSKKAIRIDNGETTSK
jgi:hypothetical protein